MPDFKVTPEDIANAATACHSTAQDIQDQLAETRNYVVTLEDVWGGIASNTFQELMQLFDACSRSLDQALNDIGDGLQGNFVNYTDSEQANIQSIQQIENELSSANLG